MEGHIFGQRHRQVKAQGQVGIALLEAVDLLLRFPAALGQQYLTGLDDRCVQGVKPYQLLVLAQDVHHALHLLLGLRQQLHKAREGRGVIFAMFVFSFYYEFRLMEKKRSHPCIGTRA